MWAVSIVCRPKRRPILSRLRYCHGKIVPCVSACRGLFPSSAHCEFRLSPFPVYFTKRKAIMRSRLCSIGALLAAFSCIVLAQGPVPPSGGLVSRPMLNFAAIPRPPVPPDPLELSLGAAQPVQDAQQRIAAISMLNKARDLSNVRAHPYYLKTSFVSSGGL